MKITVLAAVAGFAIAFAPQAFAQDLGGVSGQSGRAHVTLICKTGPGFTETFPCDLPGDSPVPLAGSYATGNAFGKIRYNTAAAQQIGLLTHGLDANTWYLMTLQDPTGADQFSANGAVCLFGIQGSGSGFEFCDIAVYRTNSFGDANVIAPTDSGLSGAAGPPCLNSNVPGLIPGPSLGALGAVYSGVTLVVKNVGVGSDGTAPNCGSPASGGLNAPHDELFEGIVLPDFTL